RRGAALRWARADVPAARAPKAPVSVPLPPPPPLLRVPPQRVPYVPINMLPPPFDDLRVRRAVNYAVNKNLIVKLLYQSLAVPATGPLPPAMWGFDGSLPRYEYNPARARALLDEAKYDRKLRPRFYITSTPRPYAPDPERIGHVIARNLHEVGMDVELVVNPLDRHLESTSRGEHDLCLRGWIGDNGDPDNFLYTLLDRDSSLTERASNV